MKLIRKIKEAYFKIKDYDRLEHNYSVVLRHATNNRISETISSTDSICQVITESWNETLREQIKEEIYAELDKEAYKYKNYRRILGEKKFATKQKAIEFLLDAIDDYQRARSYDDAVKDALRGYIEQWQNNFNKLKATPEYQFGALFKQLVTESLISFQKSQANKK